MMAASLKMATLLPCCAMRVMRPALPLIDEAMEEKVSEEESMTCWSRALS